MEEEGDASSSSDLKTGTMPNATPSSSSPDLNSYFSSMYYSIFPPRSSLSPTVVTGDQHRRDTEHRLHQARLILEYQQLCDHYDLCFVRLQAITRELEILRQENADLRLANARLLKLLTSNFHRLTEDISSGFCPKSMMEPNLFEKGNGLEFERESLPNKSISVRSNCYLKANQNNASSGPIRQRAQRVHVTAGNGRKNDSNAMELEVYNQGMRKTELCNKWQETVTCPYGEYCQFANDISELRPVIRHPKHKADGFIVIRTATDATSVIPHQSRENANPTLI